MKTPKQREEWFSNRRAECYEEIRKDLAAQSGLITNSFACISASDYDQAADNAAAVSYIGTSLIELYLLMELLTALQVHLDNDGTLQSWAPLSDAYRKIWEVARQVDTTTISRQEFFVKTTYSTWASS
jgi:hypothetical protein